MIAISDLQVTFNKGTPLETPALRGINLSLTEGQFVTIIGSNGAGKSTFLNAVAGDISVGGGHIIVAGQDITTWPTHRRAQLISRVFQDPLGGTCEALSIIENFALAHGRSRPRKFRFAIDRDLRSLARERLAMLGLGLEDRLEDQVGRLSGGQRQALSLLMATTGETKLLLLDEHTAALDPATADFVMGLTTQVVERLKVTTIMVTHSMRQALDYGKRTLMFHRGRVVFDVEGDERKALGVEDLLRLFKRKEGEELADDALLLA